jgi:hypothetical protein
MILDAQNTLSNLASGDQPVSIADNASAYYFDSMPGGLNFFAPGGGAYVAPWLIVQVRTAFTSAGSATIIAVVQDAPEPSTTMTPTGPVTWTDRIVGPTFTVGGATAPSINTYLLSTRLLPSMARYIRVVYRIAVAVMTGGAAQSFITLDQDVIDIAMRTATATITQTGQVSEAVSQGILNQ